MITRRDRETERETVPGCVRGSAGPGSLCVRVPARAAQCDSCEETPGERGAQWSDERSVRRR